MKLHVMLEKSKYENKQTTMFLLYLAAVAVKVNRRRKRPSFSILLRINFSLRKFGVEAGGKELNKYSFKNFFFFCFVTNSARFGTIIQWFSPFCFLEIVV